VDDGVTVIVFANLDKADPKVIGQGVAKIYGAAK
jgi:hypothetical protein